MVQVTLRGNWVDCEYFGSAHSLDAQIIFEIEQSEVLGNF